MADASGTCTGSGIERSWKMKKGHKTHLRAIILALLTLFALAPQVKAEQKDMPEVTIATAVSSLAFAALWLAEQLKYFEQEGVRAKITVAMVTSGISFCCALTCGASANKV